MKPAASRNSGASLRLVPPGSPEAGAGKNCRGGKAGSLGPGVVWAGYLEEGALELGAEDSAME